MHHYIFNSLHVCVFLVYLSLKTYLINVWSMSFIFSTNNYSLWRGCNLYNLWEICWCFVILICQVYIEWVTFIPASFHIFIFSPSVINLWLEKTLNSSHSSCYVVNGLFMRHASQYFFISLCTTWLCPFRLPLFANLSNQFMINIFLIQHIQHLS